MANQLLPRGNRPNWLLAPLLILTLGACVTTRATLLDPTAPRYASVPADLVRIFTDQSELDTLEYVRVAIIEASGSGEMTDQTEMLKAMRRKAGELGANGLLLPRIDEPGAGAKVAAAIFGTDTERKGNVVAIRVLGTKKKANPPATSAFTRLWRTLISNSGGG